MFGLKFGKSQELLQKSQNQMIFLFIKLELKKSLL